LHGLATDAEIMDAPLAAGAERGHELAAQRIARVLAGNEEDAQVIAAARRATLAAAAGVCGPRRSDAIGKAHAPPLGRGAAMRNCRKRSALSMPCASSSGSRPTTATPARCAEAAAAMTETISPATASETTAIADRPPQRRRPHCRWLPARAISDATP